MNVTAKSLCRKTKQKLAHNDNKSNTLPAEVPRVWSNMGPVPYEAVDPWFLVQSKSSSGNCVHRHKDRSKEHLYANKNIM